MITTLDMARVVAVAVSGVVPRADTLAVYDVLAVAVAVVVVAVAVAVVGAPVWK